MATTKAVYDLISTIGPGKMPAVAYDTAWAARLNEIAPEIGNRALDWICEHQLADGSWGAAEPFYYHDRVICTLAAMIALAQRGRRAGDRKMVERGMIALNRIVGGATQGLAADPNGETIGFEMIVPTLVADAQRLGLIENQGDRILGRMGNIRKIKQEKLRNRISRYVTPAFSAEMAGTEIDLLNIDELPESNGSIGYSPAASAYYALFVKEGNPEALAYLSQISTADGGMPNAAPFDVFEVGWTLWNLAMTNPYITFDPLATRHFDFLKKAWQPGHGVGFAAGYSVMDGDETGLVYDILRQANYDVDIKALLAYEKEDHFLCFALEADPSMSAHAHLLSALRRAGMATNDPSVRKIIGFLERSRNPSGYWFDKWHLSPYYVTSHIIIACSGYSHPMILQAVDWILATQKPNGSWGTRSSTAEETAYCIQALWVWMQTQNSSQKSIASGAIKKSLLWLKDQTEPPYPPMWIGKCLYCPENVVRSAIHSALILAEG